MNRPISEDDLHAYVDRVLDAARQAEVEAYLRDHPDVAAYIQGFARQREQLRETLAPVAQEPVPPELGLEHLIEARRRPVRSARRLAAAAILLVVLGGLGGWFGRDLSPSPASGVAALAREALDSYAVYGPDHVRPVEIKAADGAALLDWVSRRLERPVVAPDLASAGYRFMGGRLVATPHGPAALFMYDDDRGMRLVVLVRPMAVEQSAPMSRHTDGRVSGFAWAQHGLGYSLVGAAPPETLHPLADEVRRQTAKDA